jgi:hypothetical protein
VIYTMRRCPHDGSWLNDELFCPCCGWGRLRYSGFNTGEPHV